MGKKEDVRWDEGAALRSWKGENFRAEREPVDHTQQGL